MRLDAARAELRQQGIAEVKPGGRRGDGARRPRVHGLIPLDVFRSRLRMTRDVRRERRDTKRSNQLVDRAVEALDDADPVRLDGRDA